MPLRLSRELLADPLLVPQQNHALDEVLELADVARPAVAHEQRSVAAVTSQRAAVVLLGVLLRGSASTRIGIVVAALPQRRHADVDDVEAVVQVLAEPRRARLARSGPGSSPR